MTRISESASGRIKSDLGQKVHTSLLDACARRAAELKTDEIKRLLPTFSYAHISYMRGRKGKEFGFDRLFAACQAFGIPCEIRIGDRA